MHQTSGNAVTRVCVLRGDEGVEARALTVEHWGHMGTGTDEGAALESLRGIELDLFCQLLEEHGRPCPALGTLELISEPQYDDWCYQAATGAEVDRTLEILDWNHRTLVAEIQSASDEELDWDDPERSLPEWASWRTPRQLAYHVAITSSRYYLTNLGVPPPSGWAPKGTPWVWATEPPVLHALDESWQHVRDQIPLLPRDLRGDAWPKSTREMLWQLTSHERRETNLVRHLIAKARRRLS